MLPAFWGKFKPLYAVDSLQGYTDQDIEVLKVMFGVLPSTLERYYRAAGRTNAFHRVEDIWILPELFQKWEDLQIPEFMVLLIENQDRVLAGIRKEDLVLSDPPVYTTICRNAPLLLCSPTTSEFLCAALSYESTFAFTYKVDSFYWLTENEMAVIKSKFLKLPFELRNWLDGMKITLYSNEPDSMVAVMDYGNGALFMRYGAASKKSFEKLATALEGVGKPGYPD